MFNIVSVSVLGTNLFHCDNLTFGKNDVFLIVNFPQIFIVDCQRGSELKSLIFTSVLSVKATFLFQRIQP